MSPGVVGVEKGEIMSELQPIVEHARAFFMQQLPADAATRIVPIAVLFLMAGVGLSVLGAKLAKPAMTIAFVLAGAVAGWAFARQAEIPAAIGAIVAAGMFGTIAYLTFRMWVGLAAGVVLSVVALGTFGYRNVVPQVHEFEGVVAWTPTAGATQISAQDPSGNPSYTEDNPAEWVSRFWAFVKARDASIEDQVRMVGLASLVVGAFLGVVAVRWMLIVTTSLVGTVCVVSGVTTLLTHWIPTSYPTMQSNPAVMGMGVGGFLVTSLILQTLLTRSGPPKDSKKKSG